MMHTLYRDHILEHWRNPQNFGKLDAPTHEAFLNNPLCGDEIGMQLAVRDGVIDDIRFEGRGCAISIAAASFLTDEVKGKKISAIQKMNNSDIVQLLGVEPNPSRMKCALLGLSVLQKAIFP